MFERTAGSKRDHTKIRVDTEYARLRKIVGDDFSRDYFNSASVLGAEDKGGLAVCDAALGRVLASANDNLVGSQQAEELISRVARALKPSEARGRCHNIAAALVLFLAQIDYPSVMAWGLVSCVASDGREFVLNPLESLAGPHHRPGHGWLVTPHWRVVDLSLAIQGDVGDSYDSLQPIIPNKILATSHEDSPPDPQWWRLPGMRSTSINPDQFANETEYHSILGWTRVALDEAEVRYVPGAMVLPGEADMNDIDLKIAGRRPGDFYRRFLTDI